MQEDPAISLRDRYHLDTYRGGLPNPPLVAVVDCPLPDMFIGCTCRDIHSLVVLAFGSGSHILATDGQPKRGLSVVLREEHRVPQGLMAEVRT